MIGVDAIVVTISHIIVVGENLFSKIYLEVNVTANICSLFEMHADAHEILVP